MAAATAAPAAPPSTSGLDIYLPPSSPLFVYSPNIPPPPAGASADANFTSAWKGIGASTGAAPAQSGGWGDTTPKGSEAGAGNVKQTGGNAAFVLNGVHLTSFTPIFDAPQGYSTSLLSSTNGPAAAWTTNQTFPQPFGPSSLLFAVTCADPAACPSAPFIFHGAHIGTEVAPPAASGAAGSAVKNAVADDASGLVKYTGWSPAGKDNNVIAPGSGDYGGTLSMTATANASAIVKFRGTAVLLRGVTAPPLGMFTIALDSATPQAYTARDEVTTHDVPLFFASALDGTAVHQLALTTLPGGDGSTGAVIDRVEVWGAEGAVGFLGDDGNIVIPPVSPIVPPSTGGGGSGGGNGGTNPGGTLTGATGGGAPSAGAVVGIIIGVLAALILMYYFFRKYGRPAVVKPKSNEVNKWDAANNLQAMKQEAVLVTTVAEQRYVYPGMIAYSDLKAK